MTQQRVMQQVQAVIQVLTCSRRQQKPATTSNNMGTKRVTDERVALKRNDIGDVSTDDVSEHSRHLSGSSDSDADSTPPEDKAVETTIPPTNLARFAPPPGLEVDEPQQHAEQAHTSSRTALTLSSLVERHVASNEKANSRWNPNASPFVPDSSKNLLALKEALDRLAPNEVATVKSILDSKMSDNGMVNSSLQHSPWDSIGAARRPFRPFGGRTQPQQSRQAMETDARSKNIQNDSSGDSLRTYLRDLSLVDNGRVLALRKISKLGLNSGELLETYFSKFGKVDRIMVSHTLTKTNQQSNKTRLRPAALGFALMATVEEARAALNCGESHMVAGVEISVNTFQSHSIDGTD